MSLKVPPSTIDQAAEWLEDMQHRLNLCIKTHQKVHPRTLIVAGTISAVIHRTVGSMWDTLYARHTMRDSDITMKRIYAMLAEFLIELRVVEEQEKITQIVNGMTAGTLKPTLYDEYISASKGKLVKGRGKSGDPKGQPRTWKVPCQD